MYPRFFTPNDDGFNDFWKIKFSEQEPDIAVSIFNCDGKLMEQLSGSDSGWDGKLNGNPLPSTDYWFIAKRHNGQEFNGHFSLTRHK